MRAPPSNRSKCRFVTFYSYKGGTGRSMLLANVAWILATNGHRVLAVDWDLEAPGLHRYFHPFLTDKTLSATDGLMDAITEFVEAAVFQDTNEDTSLHTNQDTNSVAAAPRSSSNVTVWKEQSPEDPEWYKSYANLLRYAVPLNYKFPLNGRLDLIGAGRQGPAYAARVNLFDWEQFYVRFAGNAFLETAKAFMREQYQYVLIDSRTGVSDTSGICTMQMPDTMVVCFTLNNQSIEGARAVALAAQEYRARSTLGPITIFPVPARVDVQYDPGVGLGRELAQVRFRQFVPVDPTRDDQERAVQLYWGNVEVPYVPKYAYEEILACFGDMPHLKSSLLSSAEQIATLLRGQQTELVPPTDEDRAAVLQQFARKPYIVTTAEEFVASLTPSDQEAARQLFTRLVKPNPTKDPNAPDVPSKAPMGDLSEDALRVLGKAVAAKLVSITGDGANRSMMLADNRLVTAWPRFIAWIDKDREFLVWRQRFDQLFHTWEASNGDPDDLLTGTSLSEASKWHVARASELNQREFSFIDASKKANELVLQAEADPAFTRRVQKADWEERQRLEERVRELDSTKSKYSKLRWIAVTVSLLSLAVALYFFWKLWTVKQLQRTGTTTQSSTGAQQTSPSDQRLQTEARRLEANTLVSAGVVDSYEAASKLDPVEGILAIDKLVSKARHEGPESLSKIKAARIDYLRNSEPLFDSSPGLRRYVCAHNSYVIAASERPGQAAERLKFWKKKYPLAEIGPPTESNPNWVPVIVEFFLTCDEARQEVRAIGGDARVPPRGWYTLPECIPCRYPGEAPSTTQ